MMNKNTAIKKLMEIAEKNPEVKKFIIFLVERGVLDNFISYSLEDPDNKDKDNPFWFLEEAETPYGYIDSAFNWKDTEEGIDFWIKMNSYWCDYVEKRIEKNKEKEDVKSEKVEKEKVVIVDDLDKISPNHYKQKQPEPISVIMSWGLNFCEGNIIKYLARYKDKNGLEDLKKAYFYLSMLLKREGAFEEDLNKIVDEVFNIDDNCKNLSGKVIYEGNIDDLADITQRDLVEKLQYKLSGNNF